MSEVTRDTAKKHRECFEYINAEHIYSILWSNKGDNWDYWLGWEYADTLKKLGKVNEAINICKEIYHKWPTFKYNNDLLCWSLYEKYIKPLSEESSFQEIRKMIIIAEFILKTCKQEGKKSAYECTVFKVVDILKLRNNVNENEILRWLDRLDYMNLSNETITFNLNDGRQKEGASRIEEFFSIKTKALEKSQLYEECIKWCDIAFETINKFHYDNDIWIKLRRYYCICMTSEGENFNNSIKEIEMLANKKRHWSIFSKIFDCYFKAGEYQRAIVYGSKALLSKDPIDKKVALLYNFGVALEKIENFEDAIKHFILVRDIRNNAGWSINQDLKEKLNYYNKSLNVGIRELNELWLDYSQSDSNMLNGTILSIMPHGKSGFIKDGEKNYFFRAASILSGYKLLKVGKSVSYRIIESFDAKKQVNSFEAVDITIGH